jgi:hypothetical protein
MQTGDTVKIKHWDDIRPLLDDNLEKDGLWFLDRMRQFCGESMTILTIKAGGDVYLLEDNGIHSWRDWMFETDTLDTVFASSPVVSLLSAKVHQLYTKIAKKEAKLKRLKDRLFIYSELLNKQ